MSEKIIDKIRKLFAQAESEKTLGNEAAASAFSAKVQELLDKHNLDLSDVELAAADAEAVGGEEIPLATDRCYVWQSHLSGSIAILNGCAAFERGDTHGAVVFGRKSDREIVIELFRYFERLAMDLAEEAERAYRIRQAGWFFLDSVSHFAEFRQSFLAGFVITLCKRMQAVRAETRETVRGTGNALLVTDRRSNEAMNFVRESYPVDENDRSAELPRSQSGFFSGAAAGERVALSTKRIAN